MISLILFFLLAVAQMCFIAYREHQCIKERASLLNRIQAADAKEVKMLESASKPKKEKEEKPIQFV